MKKYIIFLGMLLAFTFLAIQKSSAQDEKAIKFIVGEQEFPAVLYDTPAANALYAQLPLTLTFEDFNNIEKIAYMDTKLPTEGDKMEFAPNAGDICLYAPWGNLSLFYKDFRNSKGLVSLGFLNNGIEFFAGQQNDFTVHIERVE